MISGLVVPPKCDAVRFAHWKGVFAAHCTAVVVHLPGGGTQQLAPQQGGTLTFPVGKVGGPERR
jgi:hypothetical protein